MADTYKVYLQNLMALLERQKKENAISQEKYEEAKAYYEKEIEWANS